MAEYQRKILRLPSRLAARRYCPASWRNDYLSQGNEWAVDRGDRTCAIKIEELTSPSSGSNALWPRPRRLCRGAVAERRAPPASSALRTPCRRNPLLLR